MNAPAVADAPRVPVGTTATRDLQTTLRPQASIEQELATWVSQGGATEERVEAARRIRHCARHNETILCLSHMGLTSLPHCVGRLRQLETLLIDHNRLNALPASIANLQQLECLVVNHNQFRSLPEALGAMTRLRTLRAHHNQLTALPQNIPHWVCLLDLQVQHNRIWLFPEQLNRLRRGAIVHMTDNAIPAAQLATLHATMEDAAYVGPVIYLDPATAAAAPTQAQSGDYFQALSPSKKIQTLLEAVAHINDGRDAAPQNFQVGGRNMTRKECLLMALELALENRTTLVPAISSRVLSDLPDDTTKFLVLGVHFKRDRLMTWSRDQGLPERAGTARDVVEVKPILKNEVSPQNVHDTDVRMHFVEQYKLISARVARRVSVGQAVDGITRFLNSTPNSHQDRTVLSAVSGLQTVTSRTDRVAGFPLSPAETLALVWTHIENTDPALNVLLKDALKNRLVEIGQRHICGLGLTERLIDIPTAVDWSVTYGISGEHLNIEIATMASEINEEYESLYGADADRHREAAEAAGNTQKLGDIEERINTVKRDMFFAKAQVELVLLRNLDETFVKDQIRNIFPSGDAMRVQM